MPDHPVPSEFLQDPLSEITRKERRNALAVSTLGFFTAFADVVPSRIAALGIEFGQINRTAYLLMLAAVILYFLLAFLFSGLFDYLNWDYKYENYKIRVDHADEHWSYEQQRQYDEKKSLYAQTQSIVRRSHRVARWRIDFEFFFPFPVALFAMIALIVRAVSYM